MALSPSMRSKLTMADFKREWGKKRWISPSGHPEDNFHFREFRRMIKFYYIVTFQKELTAKRCRPLIPEQIGAGLL